MIGILLDYSRYIYINLLCISNIFINFIVGVVGIIVFVVLDLSDMRGSWLIADLASILLWHTIGYVKYLYKPNKKEIQ